VPSVAEAPSRIRLSETSATTPGVLPSQLIYEAVEAGYIQTPQDDPIPVGNYQPASLDLRLGDVAHRLQCSFLTDRHSTVESELRDIVLGPELDLRNGAVLEQNRPYLIPLLEELDLPSHIRAQTNPKSSTGRVDIFTRVVTDRNYRFDEIPAGYRGRLYLEVVPLSFTVKVSRGLTLNQLRLIIGEARNSDQELREIHRTEPLLFRGTTPIDVTDLPLARGLFLSLDLRGKETARVGYRARKNSQLLDLSSRAVYAWEDFWEPVRPVKGGKIILEPEEFYLLLSAEGARIPPRWAAEMAAYDPTAGELRTHYAGFFDPGFGYDRARTRPGTRAALEVRARDVPFMVEHGQPLAKLQFEEMLFEPEVLYGEESVRSSYQDQAIMLSKHFRQDDASRQLDLVPPKHGEALF
jgi:dCTP deaminase